MPYSIEYHASESYVMLTMQGKATLAEFERARSEAVAALLSHQMARLLVDSRQLLNSVTTFELFQFSASHVEKFPRGVRIAVLIRADRLEDGSFAENVANNRGVILKIFTDNDEAVSWLQQKQGISK